MKINGIYLMGCWLLVVGCWLLVVGCRLLVVGCWLLVFGIWLSGTVFQTAVSLFHVIPRLRPGLLSLRSVLASSQIYQQPTTDNRQRI